MPSAARASRSSGTPQVVVLGDDPDGTVQGSSSALIPRRSASASCFVHDQGVEGLFLDRGTVWQHSPLPQLGRNLGGF